MKQLRTLLLALPIILFFVPVAASAATTVNTAQLLPLGANSCQSLTVLSATPYMQNGALESYDLVIADPSYVSVIASVGETSVPLRYMTRWPQQNGTLKIHVDVPETMVRGTMPITTTLLSSPAGKPTCAATVTFSVTGPSISTSSSGSSGSTSSTGSKGSTSSAKPSKGSEATTSMSGTVRSTSTATGSVSVVTPIFAASLSDKLKTLCTASSAFQLWFVLLALYAVIVALTALARPPLYESSPILPLIAILIPLVLFVGFWYFAPVCRAANWIPLILVAAAIAGLLATYRDRAATSHVIQLPPAKS